MSVHQEDLRTVRDALLVLSGHLPLFSADRRKVTRANEHLALRDQAFAALDRISDALSPRNPSQPERRG